MVRHRIIATSALLASVAILPFHAFAQDAESSQKIDADRGIVLDAITVVGNWLDAPNKEKMLKHPGARTIVDRKEFEERGAQDIRDALNQIPGVQVQESNGTGGSDVSLNLGVRGLTSRLSPRSTVLMDGIPLSYAP
jgi:Fe(3+) dicitrate transport protein